jgi:uncharacterized protein YeaO (DUF488 family)
MIKIKRVYDPPEPGDGKRFLVDRLWPRGVNKEVLKMDGWLKDIAPSDNLRKWFGHDPEKWEEFQRRYEAELDNRQEVWKVILKADESGSVTLIYGARDEQHNNAVVLREYLEKKRDA